MDRPKNGGIRETRKIVNERETSKDDKGVGILGNEEKKEGNRKRGNVRKTDTEKNELRV